MKLNDAARELIGEGTDATLVTINPDGSPQVTVVWVALESTPDGDELVAAHLAEYQKTRNIRRDPRVAVTILSTKHPLQQTPYLAITGTARRFKSARKLGLGAELARLAIAAADPELRAALEASAADLRSVTRARAIDFVDAAGELAEDVAPGLAVAIEPL